MLALPSTFVNTSLLNGLFSIVLIKLEFWWEIVLNRHGDKPKMCPAPQSIEQAAKRRRLLFLCLLVIYSRLWIPNSVATLCQLLIDCACLFNLHFNLVDKHTSGKANKKRRHKHACDPKSLNDSIMIGQTLLVILIAVHKLNECSDECVATRQRRVKIKQ